MILFGILFKCFVLPIQLKTFRSNAFFFLQVKMCAPNSLGMHIFIHGTPVEYRSDALGWAKPLEMGSIVWERLRGFAQPTMPDWQSIGVPCMK